MTPGKLQQEHNLLLMKCDLCGQFAPVRYLDHDIWACEECRTIYLRRLELEG